jgi:hypothetical protein
MNLVFSEVPISLYRELSNFLNAEDYWRFINMSNSNPFKLIKHETRIITVNSKETEIFLEDENFRNNILSKISFPDLQLRLVYIVAHHYPDCIPDSIPLYRFICQGTNVDKGLPCRPELFENIRDLWIHGYFPFVEFPTLPNLKGLRLVHNHQVKDFSLLENLHEVFLEETDISNVDCFCNVNILKLKSCPKVEDVSKLGKVYDVTFIECAGILDVAVLTNNSRVCIRGCLNIKTFNNCFKRAKNIVISPALSLTGLKQFENVIDLTVGHFPGNKTPVSNTLMTVSFSQCMNLNDLTSFSNVHNVSFWDCSNVFHLDGLNTVRFFNIVRCDNLVDISAIGIKAQSVRIDHCGGIKDYGYLKNVPRVHLISSGIANGHDLENVHHLTLLDCKQITDISMLGNVFDLELVSCPNISSVQGLENVAKIQISMCKGLKSLDGLGNNQKIILDLKLFPETIYRAVFPPELYQMEEENRYFGILCRKS